MWKKGNVHVRNVDENVDDLGVYLSSQFSDVSLENMIKYNIPFDEEDAKCVEVTNGKKLDTPMYFIKYGIANLILPGFIILRLSINLKKSTKEKKKRYEARKEVGYRIPTYKSSLKLTVENDEKSFSDIIVKEYYNIKRFSRITSPNEKDLEMLNPIETYRKNEEREIWKCMKNLKSLTQMVMISNVSTLIYMKLSIVYRYYTLFSYD